MADPGHPRDLQQWLAWQERLSVREIDLGLERVQRVGARLGVLDPAVPVITVAGTNGKGSIVAYLEAMLSAGGYRCGTYTSPHLFVYNERVRVGGRPCSDTELVAAFEAVEQARDGVPLTYFEFGTLAALRAFQEAGVDVLLLEVGLGGRLDAVNAVDPDVAVIASIGLDHADWLGDTLSAVAREKAGIMRRDRPAVFAAPDMPPALWEAADGLGARVWAPGHGFSRSGGDDGWTVSMDDGFKLAGLPTPGIAGPHQRDNAAAAITALGRIRHRLPLPGAAMTRGLADARLPGRCQTIAGPVEWLVDIAHNADAVAGLAGHLRTLPPAAGRTWVLLGAMARKEREDLLAPLAGAVDGYFLVTLPQPGAWTGPDLAEVAARLDPHTPVHFVGPAASVFDAMDGWLRPGDRVVAFGSFHTVEWLLSAARRETGDHATRGQWLPRIDDAVARSA
ncbi:bifunctional folylpolyglutamate synthase/dihydrofolate synthase [Ectothiorhodospiraceae bacterium WFHF3C12]|nr:bifunctional folylpolyglutamate synthase/dihydrofolate synthase [Ectothiorhodospiraceae bacterium WFHF3C12]